MCVFFLSLNFYGTYNNCWEKEAELVYVEEDKKKEKKKGERCAIGWEGDN